MRDLLKSQSLGIPSSSESYWSSPHGHRSQTSPEESKSTFDWSGLESSKQLSQNELKNIQRKLSEDFKSPIKIDYKYDPNLVAGLILQVGSIMVDTSIRSKLKQLEKNMVEV